MLFKSSFILELYKTHDNILLYKFLLITTVLINFRLSICFEFHEFAATFRLQNPKCKKCDKLENLIWA